MKGDLMGQFEEALVETVGSHEVLVGAALPARMVLEKMIFSDPDARVSQNLTLTVDKNDVSFLISETDALRLLRLEPDITEPEKRAKLREQRDRLKPVLKEHVAKGLGVATSVIASLTFSDAATGLEYFEGEGDATLAVIATFVDEASAAAALQSSFGDPKPVYWNDLAVNFDGVMVERGARTRRLRRSSVATRTRLTG